MGALKRVPDGAIRESLARWGGNVAAASREVDMAPVNFRKRLSALGLRPQRARRIIARLEAVQLEALRQAKYDLQARERRDLDESAILCAFFSDAFASWLHSKLESGARP
jgi:hypothetical protein